MQCLAVDTSLEESFPRCAVYISRNLRAKVRGGVFLCRSRKGSQPRTISLQLLALGAAPTKSYLHLQGNNYMAKLFQNCRALTDIFRTYPLDALKSKLFCLFVFFFFFFFLL